MLVENVERYVESTACLCLRVNMCVNVFLYVNVFVCAHMADAARLLRGFTLNTEPGAVL